MGATRFLVENFFHPTMFAGHAISADEETTGHEAFRVGSARRQDRSYWMPSTPNAAHNVDVDCGVARSADLFFLDRNNNLAGHTITLQHDDDAGFSTPTNAFSVTVPSSSSPGTAVSNGVAVRTEEGATLVRFASASDRYWRLLIPAMGAGLVPQVGGAYLGTSWSPTSQARIPWDDDAVRLAFDEVVTPYLTTAATRKARGRTASLLFQLGSTDWATTARAHIREKVWAGHVVWWIPDEANGEKAGLFFAPPGDYGAVEAGRAGRDVALALVEYDPVLL